MTAAIYTSREGLDTLLLEKLLCGGLPASTELIENYPGFPDGVNGSDLIEKFKKQAQRFGTEIAEYHEVTKVQPLEKKVRVKTADGEYDARSLIVASGSVPKKLNVPGEGEFYGKGVSYCATCDGPLFRDKDVAVVGGGDAAAGEAVFLAKFARRVILVHRRDELRAAKLLQERLQKEKKVEFLLNHALTSINGDTRVNSVTVENRQTGEEKQIEISGVFIYAGFLPNSKFLKGVVELDDLGYIVTDEKMKTSVPGVYTAGDVRSKQVRQIDVACGEGTIAAISVRNYIKELV